ncbi:hypothetical protein TMatcc_009011, partial [Talaromyces marneffei ATCC 18224]
VTRLLLGLLLLLSSGRGSFAAGGSSGNRSSRSVCLRVGNAVLELLNLGPAELGLNGNSQDLLVAVDKRVHDGCKSGVGGSQRDGGDGGNSRAESLEELLVLNIQNLGTEGLAIIVDLSDGHTVGEGGDVQHVKKNGLGGTDLGASLDKLEIGGNFNGTTSNLGGDTESLEERGLTGFHTSVTSRNEDIERGNGTSTGGSGDTVGENLEEIV